MRIRNTDVEAFIAQMSVETRQMFDPDYDPSSGLSQLDERTLRARVASYLEQRAKVNMQEAGEQRDHKYSVTGDRDGKDVLERMRRLTATGDVDERQARQQMRRSKALQEMMFHLLDRQAAGPGVIFVTVSEANSLMEEYRQARSEGYSDAQMDFLPLSAYHRKIMPEGRRPVRKLMENELGVFQMASNPASPLVGRIVCVRDKDLGTGDGLGTSARSHVQGADLEPRPAPPESTAPDPTAIANELLAGLLPAPEKK